jgi:hypothetical protein
MLRGQVSPNQKIAMVGEEVAIMGCALEWRSDPNSLLLIFPPECDLLSYRVVHESGDTLADRSSPGRSWRRVGHAG